jgi:hypothetical protein
MDFPWIRSTLQQCPLRSISFVKCRLYCSQNVPPDLSQCVFNIEQALSVRALQELVTAAGSETVKICWPFLCPHPLAMVAARVTRSYIIQLSLQKEMFMSGSVLSGFRRHLISQFPQVVECSRYVISAAMLHTCIHFAADASGFHFPTLSSADLLFSRCQVVRRYL